MAPWWVAGLQSWTVLEGELEYSWGGVCTSQLHFAPCQPLQLAPIRDTLQCPPQHEWWEQQQSSQCPPHRAIPYTYNWPCTAPVDASAAAPGNCYYVRWGRSGPAQEGETRSAGLGGDTNCTRWHQPHLSFSFIHCPRSSEWYTGLLLLFYPHNHPMRQRWWLGQHHLLSFIVPLVIADVAEVGLHFYPCLLP